MRDNPALIYGAKEYYRNNVVDFICHWVDTYDPRNAKNPRKLTYMPFVLFPKQEDFIYFLQAMLQDEEDGLVEKSRDVGATWLCVAFSIWLWLFGDSVSIGWGSRKQDLVDRIGVMDSIFEKMRSIIRRLPKEFWPKGFDPAVHMPFMRIINPETNSVISGEAGDNIGRGGRNLIYFKDESAHYERPELIEAALGDNTRVQIDLSSVHGVGNPFHRKREAGEEWIDGPAHEGVTNVFVFDWRDHPEKDERWYQKRKTKYELSGLSHIFAQEVDRSYSASVVGTLIKLEWVRSAYDAHVKLGIRPSGKRVAGLDVADEGRDRNAWAGRHGIVLDQLDEWPEGDTGETARRAVGLTNGLPVEIQYDSVGVGAGVKAEANRMESENLIPSGTKFIAWSAAASSLDPDGYVIPDDDQSPVNRDFFDNIKAQGWWELARAFEKTYKMVNGLHEYPVDELISIDTKKIPANLLRKLEKELIQVTKKQSTRTLKMVINKAPEGTTSPNLADSVMMAYWPIPDNSYTLENI